MACELVKKDDGYLYIICSEHQEPCTLVLHKQKRSFGGDQAVVTRQFHVECPKCGALGTLAA